jgi:ABC-2 type transport system permease protein
MAAVSARALLGTDKHPGFVLGSAVVGAGFIGYFHANTAGLTGPPFALEATALTGRRELRAYFSGQNIALGVIAVPLLIAVSFGLAELAKNPALGFLATAVALAGLGAALALSNIFSVVLPYPMEKRAGSPMLQAAQGFRGQQFVGVLGNVGGVAIAAIPVIVAVLLTGSDRAAVRMPVLIACGAVYGLALAWAGVRIAAQAAEQRLPELTQIAIRSKL